MICVSTCLNLEFAGTVEASPDSPLLPRLVRETIPPVHDVQNISQNDSNTSLRSDVG